MSDDQPSARLKPPVSEHDHAQGPADAPLTLVEYGDYECPYCGAAYPIVRQVQRHMGDRLRFVFRNFPLSNVHPHAAAAADAAEIAGALGQFWPMHDLLYQHQHALDTPHLAHYAGQLGLDPEQFAADLAAEAQRARVREDFLSGVRSGVNGTPTFFINGVRHDGGSSAEELVAALEKADRGG